MQIAQSQILYCKLRIEINTKIEIFSIYVTLLNNKEILKNLRISTRSNIVATYWDLTLLYLFLINILYCFKAAIEFSYIFDIKNAILRRAFSNLARIIKKLRILYSNAKKSNYLIKKTRKCAIRYVKLI